MSVDIHIHHHDEETNTKIDHILVLLRLLSVKLTHIDIQEKSIMADLKDLDAQADKALAAIQDESDKDDAIIALVTMNTAQITALRQALEDALASNDPAAVQAVLVKLQSAETNALSNGAKVLAAVNANTTGV